MELVLQRPQRKESVKKYTVLYVDDEPVNLRIFQHAFKRDYNVLTALNGFDALEMLNHQKVDLVITDQQMPRMSGVDLLAKIVPKHPSIVRMIMTGFSDIGAIIRAVNEFGLDKYLVKPWDRDQLKVEFDKALEKKDKAEEGKSKGQNELSDSVLPTSADLKDIFQDSFVLYDNSTSNRNGYWFGESKGQAVFALYNGTESKMSSFALNSFVNMGMTELVYRHGLVRPSHIINELGAKIKDRFISNSDSLGLLDISVLVVDKDKKSLEFAGANHDLYYLDNSHNLKSVQGSKKPVNLSGNTPQIEDIALSNLLCAYLVSKDMVSQIVPSEDPKIEGTKFLKLLKENSEIALDKQATQITKKMSGDPNKCMLAFNM